uniref:Uncharacterized protein n=1 Tax=Anopheles dirus TaxID=7168 RepID=A0A182NYF0_9DIPT
MKYDAVGGARKSSKSFKTKESSREQRNLSKATGGASGAKRLIRTQHIEDDSSTTNDFNQETNNTAKSAAADTRSPDYHLDSRLTHHTVRFAGEIKKISEETNIPISDLIKAGRSLYKAARESAGPDFHQAHVLRLCLNPELVKDHPELYTLLKNHTGHTQMVDKFVNVFHKIGGDIDKSQAQWITDLASIDFTKGLNEESVGKLESYRSSVMSLYQANIDSSKYSKAETLMLEKAKK